MMRCHIFSKIAVALQESEKTYRIQARTKNLIMFVPVIIILLQTIAWTRGRTKRWSLWLLEENHPIELLTFVILVIAGVVGVLLAFKLRKTGEGGPAYGFYMIFSIALFFIAMEEVAWSQWFIGFETPENWRSLNRQGETTLHNLGGMHGHSEILRLIFGIGGLIGVYLSFSRYFRRIGCPALLLPWIIIIIVHASLDVFNDVFPIQVKFDFFIQRTSELIELFIAVTAFLYLQLNSRAPTLRGSPRS